MKTRIDPVCKMKIEEMEHKTMHEGEEICFCSKECKLKSKGTRPNT